MNFASGELKKLAPPLALLAALLVAGAGLVTWAQLAQRSAAQQLGAARAEYGQAQVNLTRIAEEERKIKDKIEVYRRLKSLQILGEEQRLEWADAMSRIRTSRELLDLRYIVERQRLLLSAPGKPANVDFYASTMKLDVALLHEGDLIGLLKELRDSGNAYYAVKRCSVTRTGIAATGASIVPRLRAGCDIDLITILDRAAKT